MAIGGDQAENAFPFMGLAGFVPGHRGVPGHPAAPGKGSGIFAVQLGDGDQPGVRGVKFDHLNEGSARLGPAVQQVVAAALGAPTAAAQPEKPDGIGDGWTRSG